MAGFYSNVLQKESYIESSIFGNGLNSKIAYQKTFSD